MVRFWGRLRGERGAALIEFATVGIIMLFPLTYAMLGAFEVQKAMFGVTAAAREATRAYTLTEGSCGQAQGHARAAARVAMRDQGLDMGNVDMEISSDPPGECLTPGSAAVADLEYSVAIPFWPAVLGKAPSIQVTAHHRTPYGQYRSSGG